MFVPQFKLKLNNAITILQVFNTSRSTATPTNAVIVFYVIKNQEFILGSSASTTYNRVDRTVASATLHRPVSNIQLHLLNANLIGS